MASVVPQRRARWVAMALAAMALALALLALVEGLVWSIHPLPANGGATPAGRLAARAALAGAACALAAWWAFRPRHAVRVVRRFFTSRSHPLNLGVFRIILFAVMLWQIFKEPPWFWTRMPRDLLVPPWGFNGIASWMFSQPSLAGLAGILFILVCSTGILGFFSRTSALLAAILGLWVLGLPQCFGMVTHYHHLIWFALLLAVSPCGDALAIDNLLQARRGRGAVSPSRAHALPLRMAWLLMGVLFFFPGFWKLASVGLDWAAAENLRNIGRTITAVNYRPTVWSTEHVNSAVLCAGGLAAILFELSFVFLVFKPRFRAPLALLGLVFHNSTGLIIQIWFTFLQPFYVILIDWHRAVRRLRHWIGGADLAPWTPWTRPSLPAKTSSGPLWPIALVGIFLLSINIAFGAGGKVNSWPFACYPTFAARFNENPARLDIYQVGSNGAEQMLRLDLAQKLGRWNRMANQALFVPDPASRQRKFLALQRVLVMWSVPMDPASPLRFYRQTLHLALQSGGNAEPTREFLGQVNPADFSTR